jgi:hypothetical protein
MGLPFQRQAQVKVNDQMSFSTTLWDAREELSVKGQICHENRDLKWTAMSCHWKVGRIAFAAFLSPSRYHESLWIRCEIHRNRIVCFKAKKRFVICVELLSNKTSNKTAAAFGIIVKESRTWLLTAPVQNLCYRMVQPWSRPERRWLGPI